MATGKKVLDLQVGEERAIEPQQPQGDLQGFHVRDFQKWFAITCLSVAILVFLVISYPNTEANPA